MKKISLQSVSNNSRGFDSLIGHSLSAYQAAPIEQAGKFNLLQVYIGKVTDGFLQLGVENRRLATVVKQVRLFAGLDSLRYIKPGAQSVKNLLWRGGRWWWIGTMKGPLFISPNGDRSPKRVFMRQKGVWRGEAVSRCLPWQRYSIKLNPM